MMWVGRVKAQHSTVFHFPVDNFGQDNALQTQVAVRWEIWSLLLTYFAPTRM